MLAQQPQSAPKWSLLAYNTFLLTTSRQWLCPSLPQAPLTPSLLAFCLACLSGYQPPLERRESRIKVLLVLTAEGCTSPRLNSDPGLLAGFHVALEALAQDLLVTTSYTQVIDAVVQIWLGVHYGMARTEWTIGCSEEPTGAGLFESFFLLLRTN